MKSAHDGQSGLAAFLAEEQDLEGFRESSETPSEPPPSSRVGRLEEGPEASHVVSLSEVGNVDNVMEMKMKASDEMVPGRSSFMFVQPILTDESLRTAFRSDKPILTQHSGATRLADGTFVMHGAVPEVIREALRAIEMESRSRNERPSPPSASAPWSVNKDSSGEFEILGDAAQAPRCSIRQQVHMIDATEVVESGHRCCLPRLRS